MSWYEVRLDPGDNGTCLVTAPAFPEVTTYGESLKLSMTHARNAIEEAIAARMARGDLIPSPIPDGKGPQYAVQMHALVTLKAGLYVLCKTGQINPSGTCAPSGLAPGASRQAFPFGPQFPF